MGSAYARLPFGAVVNRYSGRKRTMYENALASLCGSHSTALDARVKMFVKAEKAWQQAKDPRPIQARDPRHNIDLASFLLPIEHQLYSLTSFRREMGNRPGFRKTRIFGKGANSRQRAQLLLQKWDTFADPRCLSLDCSRFDCHVAPEVLEQIEHFVYLELCDPSERAELNRLLAYHLNNKGRSSTGLKYRTKGKRMSGDVNTALGNCLLMVIMAMTAMRTLGVDSYDLLDDGDDILLFLEATEVDRVEGALSEIFRSYGHSLKVEEVARELWDINWCQTKLTQRANGEAVMARDFRKVLATGGTSHRHYDNPKVGMKVMNSVGTCELYLNRGIPILQEYALMLIRESGTLEFHSLFDEALEHRIGLEFKGTLDMKKVQEHAKPMPINDATRVAFELTWGVSVDQQLLLEEQLRNHKIDWSRGLIDLGDLSVSCANDYHWVPWVRSIPW
jgi:hypothetical protein